VASRDADDYIKRYITEKYLDIMDTDEPEELMPETFDAGELFSRVRIFQYAFPSSFYKSENIYHQT